MLEPFKRRITGDMLRPGHRIFAPGSYSTIWVIREVHPKEWLNCFALIVEPSNIPDIFGLSQLCPERRLLHGSFWVDIVPLMCKVRVHV